MSQPPSGLRMQSPARLASSTGREDVWAAEAGRCHESCSPSKRSAPPCPRGLADLVSSKPVGMSSPLKGTLLAMTPGRGVRVLSKEVPARRILDTEGQLSSSLKSLFRPGHASRLPSHQAWESCCFSLGLKESPLSGKLALGWIRARSVWDPKEPPHCLWLEVPGCLSVAGSH